MAAADAVDAAIAATEAPAAEPRLAGNFRASSGRLIAINVPIGLTRHELGEFIGWLVAEGHSQVTAHRAATAEGRLPRPGLLVPRQVRVGRG